MHKLFLLKIFLLNITKNKFKKRERNLDIIFLASAFFQGRLGKGKQIKFQFRPIL